MDADVLVVGGGIAGWSAAWFAAARGRAVTVVDEGVDRASDLPAALVNPLRGHAGRLIAGGVDGARATFALIDALRDAGHAVVAARGLYRPLVDMAPDATTHAWWTARIAGRLDFAWHAVAPSSLGLALPVPALHLHDAGWVEPRSLLDALIAGSAALRIADRVTGVARGDDGCFVASLASGPTLRARSLLWCGGARGAALLDRSTSRPDDVASTPRPGDEASYKPGSLLAVDRGLTADALSFGLYAMPWSPPGMAAGTLFGPTREGSSTRFPDHPVPADAIGHLGDRLARVFGTTIEPRAVWRGVRLARLSAAAASTLLDVPTLTALGSRGFLMAPRQAAAWARSL